MRWVIAAALMAFCLPVLGASESRQALTEDFARALVNLDMRSLDAIATHPIRYVAAWNSVETLVTSSRCIELRSQPRVDMIGSGMSLQGRVTIDAVATGARTGRLRGVPKSWILTFARVQGHWRISEVETYEDLLAKRLATFASSDSYDGELRAGGYDSAALLTALTKQLQQYPAIPMRRRIADAALMVATSDAELARAWCINARAVLADAQQQSRLIERCRAAAVASQDTDVIAEASLAGASRSANSVRSRILSLENSVSMLHLVDDQSVPLNALATLADLYHAGGDERQALMLARRLQELAAVCRIGRAEFDAHTTMLGIYYEQDYWDLAIQEAQAAVHFADWEGDKITLLSAHSNLGACHEMSHHFDASLREYERAAELAGDLGGPIAAINSANLAGSLMNHNRLQEASEWASIAVERARATHSTPAQIEALIARSRVAYAQSRFEASGDDAAEAASLARHDHNASELEALVAEADALECVGKPDQSLPILDQAIELIETRRSSLSGEPDSQARFFSDHRTAHLSAIRILVDGGRLAEALSYAERATARVLLGSIQDIGSDPMLSLSEEQRKTLATLNQRIQHLNGMLIHGAEEPSSLAAKLNDARNELSRFRVARTIEHSGRGVDKLPDLGVMDMDIESDTVALEYVVEQDRTTVFVAYKEHDGLHVEAHQIEISQQSLNEKVDRFLRSLASRDLEYQRDADDLYRLLIAPVSERIAPYRVLCIVPNGSLWRLPFHVLAPGSGEPLLLTHSIYYAPSLGYVHAAHVRARNRNHDQGHDLMAFGNPIPSGAPPANARGFTAGDLRPLPDAAKEAIGIAALYGTASSRVYTGTSARSSVFRTEAPKYRILHVGTHALLDDHAPMNSALVLMSDPTTDDDGILDAREIASMSLNADLAVLAACDTAMGRVDEGEGMLGLSWSFMIAGCTTTVVSQWSVDSRATAILMVELHRRLRNGEAVADALRHAALTLRSRPQYAHPYYWAPFIVSGDGTERLTPAAELNPNQALRAASASPK
ncbi:MAG TPA: CHAT domain-containing protein [Thermoanaerobaculia bacterium]|nr:CHAT domain-containing protein [Thermoanaerobaculia bacterium]